MARRGPTTPARARAGALIREAPDHYALLDARLVGRLAGFLYCCAGIIAAALLALNPPTEAAGLGRAGWIPAVVLVTLAFVFGLLMLANRRPLPPPLIFAVALSGPLMLALLQWLSGPSSSFAQILILSVVWCGVVLPGGRLAIVLAINTAVVFLPAFSDAWNAQAMLPGRVATVGIVWALASVCLIHATRMRDVRRSLSASAAEADTLARVDALTGLGNRRALDEGLVVLVATAMRTGRPLSALVGDLDGFKQINDRHGHGDGDRILAEVATTMRDLVRLPDACFRWGGDEFVVLLPDTPLTDAEQVAERISATVFGHVTTASGEPVRITFGCAERVEHQTGARLLAIADAALLAAKSAQRA
ncbi:GGDEF domain-containing protein [Baekduia sp. Peel2402]|uniref:GGDEF domain-containing protein n=1 Tax=Baekduia sp. Peel2402 TaxID=3458296 RepID=UPI00403E69DE